MASSAISQKLIPHQGINSDVSEAYLNEASAFFIKNLTYEINDNPSDGTEGGNKGKFTPLESNTKFCDLQLPAGTNYCIGYHENKDYNEGFVFIYNNNMNHVIYRINGDTGKCQMVVKGAFLGFTFNPDHFISEGRCTCVVSIYFDKVTSIKSRRTFLIWTDNLTDQRMICVEDAIATNGFDGTIFPYFNNNGLASYWEMLNLGLATPFGCPKIVPIARNLEDENDRDKINQMNNRGWQFRVKGTDVWGRDTEHGPISVQYINNLGNSCVDQDTGLPRCVKIIFEAGHSIIDKWQIEYRNCTGNGLATESDWYAYETIYKYENCTNGKWWTRKINNPWQKVYDEAIKNGSTPEEAQEAAKFELKYNAADNTFEYTFCNNKECKPINVEETNRSQNPLPFKSNCVTRIGASILLSNNEVGFNPLNCRELNKIKFNVVEPEPDVCSNVKRKIRIWGILFNDYEDRYAFFRRNGAGNHVFGWADCPDNNAEEYGQKIPTSQEGIIGYLAGTNHYVISKQYRYNNVTGELQYTGLDWQAEGDDTLPVQIWDLEVPPGKYVFRIASHTVTPSDDYEKTSTYFIGLTNLINYGELNAGDVHEIVVDVCNGDFEWKDAPVMIYDLTTECHTINNKTQVVAGYLYEDDINKQPLEFARIVSNQSGSIGANYTDHNGFYFRSSLASPHMVSFYGKKDCQNNQWLQDSRASIASSGNFFRFQDAIYVYGFGNTWPEGDRFRIRGRVVLCDNPQIGITGFLVVLTRGAFGYTNSDGYFEIIAHEQGDNGGRDEQLIYSNRGECRIVTCADNCNYCFPTKYISAPPCTGQKRTLDMGVTNAKIFGSGRKGPQMGGRYGLGISMFDWMGRESFVQATDDFYVDIPNIQRTKSFSYSTIGFTMNSDIRFPDGIKSIAFYITENLSWNDFLTWTFDKVEFVNNAGDVTNINPTQIKIYYQSLNEYNIANNNSTTTKWQFIETGSDNPITGDSVEFIVNGDGKIFDKTIRALVKYDQDGKYILIDYDDELKDLKPLGLMKISRPKQCVNREIFYRLCPQIQVINGVPAIFSGTFDFFDSYMINRNIPIPNYLDPNVNTVTTFPFSFEHHSPSDKWGDHCWTKGNINVKNPQEAKMVNQTEMMISKVLLNNGNYNGLNYFTDSDKADFRNADTGAITSVIVDLNTLLVICESDCVNVPFDDNNLRVDAQGRVVLNSLENRFGRATRERGLRYGCNIKDINTIRKHKGIVMFVDRNNGAIIKHNYSIAKDITESIGHQAWLGKKIGWLKQVPDDMEVGYRYNRYLHGVIDPKTDQYYVSSFYIRYEVLLLPGQTSKLYSEWRNIKSAEDPYSNETIVIDYNREICRGFVSFVPEYFGSLSGDLLGQQLLSFKNGVCYKHYNVTGNSPTFLNFFGEQDAWYFTPVANTDNMKNKIFLWVEVYINGVDVKSETITTESNQYSRLMPYWWRRADYFRMADFKCNVQSTVDNNFKKSTTTNVLLDGDNLYGKWLKIQLTGQEKDKGKYFEMTGAIIFMSALEKSGEN